MAKGDVVAMDTTNLASFGHWRAVFVGRLADASKLFEERLASLLVLELAPVGAVVADLRVVPYSAWVVVAELDGLDSLLSRWPDVVESLARRIPVTAIRLTSRVVMEEVDIVGFRLVTSGEAYELRIEYWPKGGCANHEHVAPADQFLIPSVA